MKRLALALTLTALAACSTDSTAPARTETFDDLNINVAQPFDATSAAAVDRAGIGGSEFPDSLKLTADQKAKIQALHEAYQAATAAGVATLKAIEAEARAAIAAGKSRADVMAILEKGKPIAMRLGDALARLQRDIWAVYTPAQQAWLTGKQRPGDSCGADVLKSLTAEQVARIREFKAAFAESVKGDVATIMKVGEEARAAKQAGASLEEIRKILSRADAAMESIKAAERRLAAAILGVLTAEQKANACLVRALIGR